MRVLSVDVGTSYIKAAMVEYQEKERILRIIDALNIPQQAIASDIIHEHDPGYVLNTFRKVARNLTNRLGSPDAVCISTYLFSLILLDKDGNPLTNIITWLDRRAEKAIPKLLPQAQEIYVRTGCPILPIYSLPKLLYLAESQPQVYGNVSLVLDVKSLLTLSLTGEPVTDYSTASGTFQLLNIRDLKWDGYILGLTGIDESNLPRLEEADYKMEFKPSVARELGLSSDTPLVLGFYDGGSMIYGLTGGKERVATVNMGTSSMLRVISAHPIIDLSGRMALQTYYLYRGTWIPGIAWNNCGITLEHLVRVFGMKLEDVLEKLREVKVQDYLMSNPPITIPLLYPERFTEFSFESGISIIGMKTHHTPLDVIASTLEGLVLLLKYSSVLLEESKVTYTHVVGGGKILSIPIVRYLLASALNKELFVSEVTDVTHMGNSLIALKALGALKDEEVREVSKRILREPVRPVEELRSRINHAYMVFNNYISHILVHLRR
jgi:gluconokinase